jgi:hypothetical protein
MTSLPYPRIEGRFRAPFVISARHNRLSYFLKMIRDNLRTRLLTLSRQLILRPSVKIAGIMAFM